MKDLSSPIESLGKKLDALLQAYEQSNERATRLEDEKSSLKQKLASSNSEIERLKEENKVLRIASAIKGDDEKVTESKRKISQLVREIDKCLALLND